MRAAFFAFVLCAALDPAFAHEIGAETTGTEPADVSSVESCVTFAWTKKTRCGTYDTTNHRWEVQNDCPRAVQVIWADNAFNRPIRRDDESGKLISESAWDIQPGKKLRYAVECVDSAELEICIEYIYPPMKDPDENCDEFFD